MFDTNSTPPGEYVYDDEMKAVGRIKVSSGEDRRFIAEGKYSLKNGYKKADGSVSITKKSVQHLFANAPNDWVIKGYNLTVGMDETLSLDHWLAQAAEELGDVCGIKEILKDISEDPTKEEIAKIKTIQKIFGLEVTRRNLCEHPQIVAAKEAYQAEIDRRKAAKEAAKTAIQKDIELRGSYCVMADDSLEEEWQRLVDRADESPWWLLAGPLRTVEEYQSIIALPLPYIIRQADANAWDEKTYYGRYGPYKKKTSKWGENVNKEIEGLNYYFQNYDQIPIYEELALQVAAEYAISRYRSHHKGADFLSLCPKQLLTYMQGEMNPWGTDYYSTVMGWRKSTKRIKSFKRLRPDIPEGKWGEIETAIQAFWKAAVGYNNHIGHYFTSTQQFLDILHMEKPSSPMRKLDKISLPFGCDC